MEGFGGAFCRFGHCDFHNFCFALLTSACAKCKYPPINTPPRTAADGGKIKMANLKFFGTVNGETVAFKNIDHRGREGRFGFHPETSQWIKIERVVEFKSNPSRHECDARCVHATGKIMRCECSCGGKNHGKGFVSVGAF